MQHLLLSGLSIYRSFAVTLPKGGRPVDRRRRTFADTLTFTWSVSYVTEPALPGRKARLLSA